MLHNIISDRYLPSLIICGKKQNLFEVYGFCIFCVVFVSDKGWEQIESHSVGKMYSSNQSKIARKKYSFIKNWIQNETSFLPFACHRWIFYSFNRYFRSLSIYHYYNIVAYKYERNRKLQTEFSSAQCTIIIQKLCKLIKKIILYFILCGNRKKHSDTSNEL